MAVRASHFWQRRSKTVLAVASLASAGLLGVALLILDAASVGQLADHTGRAPTRIYARPYVLYLGMPADAGLLRRHLQRLGYVPTRDGEVELGEYLLGSRRWVIGRRHFRHHERLSSGGVITARIDYQGSIAALEDSTGRGIRFVSLEPELIGSLADDSNTDRIPVPLSDVPSHLVDAVLAIEDRRFFEHRGLDLKRIGAAALANLRAGRVVQGGSTITQQLAKNLYLNSSRNIIRKIREAAIALALELHYSKQEILEAYLNEVYLGQDGGLAVHGVGRAAQYYFGKDVASLDLAESALLASLIRGPSLYSPFRHEATARARRDLVLELMFEQGLIAEDDYREARGRPLQVRVAPASTQSVRYFTDFVRTQLATDTSLRADRGSAVFTSLDVGLQEAAEDAIRAGLEQLESQYPGLRQRDAPLQAALVALDPRNGQILAMVGGRDYGRSQFNRAVTARRQPGSAFKPVVALAAVSQRGREGEAESPFTLATILEDRRLVVQTVAGKWEPVNYDRRFRGPVTLRDALEQSLNVPFARLGLAVGPARIVETARSLGIDSPLHPVPSLALGASEISPLELTRAYGVLAAGGFRAASRPILAILDRGGGVREPAVATGQRVFDPAEAYLVTSALRGAVERGTGRTLRGLGYGGAVAAKSGTTNDFRDGWFVGYTPTLAVGVWVGFDDGRSIGLPGARVALPIFARFLRAAVGPHGTRGPYASLGFSPPTGLEVVEVDPRTGLRAGPGCRGKPEYFLPGTAPDESCSPFWSSRRSRLDGESWLRRQLHGLRDELLRLLEREGRSRRRHNPTP
ncbi:MAG: PBP1A family penicillin-binding protein [Gemmatimonadales bacterium]|jgi:penicillin-binding protein 1B